MAALSRDVGFADRAPEPRFEKIKVAGFVRLRSRSRKDVAVPSLKATDQRLPRFFNDAAQEALHRLEQDGLIATFRQSRTSIRNNRGANIFSERPSNASLPAIATFNLAFSGDWAITDLRISRLAAKKCSFVEGLSALQSIHLDPLFQRPAGAWYLPELLRSQWLPASVKPILEAETRMACGDKCATIFQSLTKPSSALARQDPPGKLLLIGL